MFNFTAFAKAYILYLRKSTDVEDKQVESLQIQLETMIKFRVYGFNIVEIIEEKQSAFHPGRPKFDSIIERVKTGEIDGILVYDTNRISRNPIDGGMVTHLLSTGQLKHFQSRNVSYTPQSNLMPLQFELIISFQDSRNKGGFIKGGLRKKAFRGWYPVGHFAGYHHVRKDSNLGKEESIVITDENYAILRHLWEMALSGNFSLSDIHREAHVLGFKSGRKALISYNALSNMFKNEFYSGFYHWHDEDEILVRIKGNHKPIVSEYEFLKVQKTLFRPKKIKKHYQSIPFTYKSIILCRACDRSIVGQRKVQTKCPCKHRFSSVEKTACPKCDLKISKMVSPWQIDRTYYGCCGKKYGCKAPYISEQQLEEQIIQKLHTELKLDKELCDLLMKLMKNPVVRKKISSNELLPHQRKILTELESKKDKYMDMRADGEITKEDYMRRTTKLHKQIAETKLKISEMEEQKDNWHVQIIDLLSKLSVCVDDFKSQPKHVKRSILETFQSLGSNHFLRGKKLELSIPKVLFVIKDCFIVLKKILARVDNLNTLENIVQNAENPPDEGEFSELWCRLREVRTHSIERVNNNSKL